MADELARWPATCAPAGQRSQRMGRICFGMWPGRGHALAQLSVQWGHHIPLPTALPGDKTRFPDQIILMFPCTFLHQMTLSLFVALEPPTHLPALCLALLRSQLGLLGDLRQPLCVQHVAINDLWQCVPQEGGGEGSQVQLGAGPWVKSSGV